MISETPGWPLPAGSGQNRRPALTGEPQRLAIARALLADPQILILDEATSNLDSHSEQLIQESLQRLVRGRTTFVIAHRLSTVRMADLIAVIDQGRLLEVGTHEELRTRQGLYAEMIGCQFGSNVVSADRDDTHDAMRGALGSSVYNTSRQQH